MKLKNKIVAFLFTWLFCFLNVCWTQNTIQKRLTFYDYLKDLSETFDLQFAVNPDIAANLEMENYTLAETKKMQLNQLKELLKTNDLAYLILDDNRILIRKKSKVVQKVADQKKIISGQIIAADNGETLAFASIFIPQTNCGVVADDNGYFAIEIPKKYWDQTLHFQSLSFETQELEIKNCQNKLTIKLAASKAELKTILIVEAPPQMHFNQEDQSLRIDLSNYEKTGAGDFFTSFNGNVMTSFSSILQSTKREGIFVRGFQSNSLILMDEIPVLRYNNYYSFLNNYNELYFDQINIYKNASPLGWEQYAFGIINLKSKAFRDQSILNLETNLFFTSTELNLPLNNNKWSIKLAGRKSYQDINKDPFEKKKKEKSVFEDRNGTVVWNLLQKPEISFYDLNASIQYQDEKQMMSASFMKSQQDVNFENEASVIFPATRIKVNESLEQNDETKNIGFALKYERSFSNDWSAYLSAHHTKANKEVITNLMIDGTNDDGEIEQDFGFRNRLENEIKITEIKSGIEKEIGKSVYKFGVGYTALASDFLIKDEEVNPFKAIGNYDYVFGFGEAKKQWHSKFKSALSIGNFTHLSTGKNYWNTKLQLNYQALDRFAIRGGFSYQTQFFNEANLENSFGQNYSLLAVSDDERIPVSKVKKWMLGSQWYLDQWKINTEFYFNHIDGVINVVNRRASLRADELENRMYRIAKGKGKNYGLDISIQYRKKAYQSLIEYTWSKSKVQYEKQYRSVELLSSLDRTHQLNWTQNLFLGKWTLTASNHYYTGTPYIDYQRFGDVIDRDEIENVNSLIKRLPFYYSLDLGVTYDFEILKQKSKITLSLLNTTNHENVQSILQFGQIRDMVLNQLSILSSSQYLDRQVNLSLKMQLF